MSPAERKKLPVGIESFEKIRQENFYYVDKTYMIRDLLKNWGEVNLFTRPRRFGKSLNMSMLRAFFEIGSDPTLFDGLAISEETALCEAYMGKFPVISISLKSVAAATFAEARALAVRTINEEARRLRFLLDSPVLAPEDKELFAALLQPELSDSALSRSLRELSELLWKHYGKPVVLLIDEYDVPPGQSPRKWLLRPHDPLNPQPVRAGPENQRQSALCGAHRLPADSSGKRIYRTEQPENPLHPRCAV